METAACVSSATAKGEGAGTGAHALQAQGTRATIRPQSTDPTDATVQIGSECQTDEGRSRRGRGVATGCLQLGLHLPSFTVCTLGTSGDVARDRSVEADARREGKSERQRESKACPVERKDTDADSWRWTQRGGVGSGGGNSLMPKPWRGCRRRERGGGVVRGVWEGARRTGDAGEMGVDEGGGVRLCSKCCRP